MTIRTLLVLAWLGPTSASAATLFAANSGLDGPACGTTAAPCRSITTAIANASAGDKIVVRPGLYSDDLDLDGSFGEAGEEPGPVVVNKAVSIESTGGAAGTLIRRVSTPGDVVSISASNVKFGRLGKGFTIKVPGGVNTTGIGVVATGVVVAGNVVTGPINFGIGAVNGDPEIRDNRVICSSGSGIGILLLPAPNSTIDRNSVEGCGQGYAGGGTGVVFTRNLAIGSTTTGFNLGDFATFTKNAAIGNGGAGIYLNSGTVPGLIVSNTFSGNDTFGNCGIRNNSGQTVTAAGNYWGAATGPGANPADQVCDEPGSTTIVAPFSSTDATPRQAPLR